MIRAKKAIVSRGVSEPVINRRTRVPVEIAKAASPRW